MTSVYAWYQDLERRARHSRGRAISIAGFKFSLNAFTWEQVK